MVESMSKPDAAARVVSSGRETPTMILHPVTMQAADKEISILQADVVICVETSHRFREAHFIGFASFEF